RSDRYAVRRQRTRRAVRGRARALGRAGRARMAAGAGRAIAPVGGRPGAVQCYATRVKKILVVEDDPVNQMILIDFLAANGYTTAPFDLVELLSTVRQLLGES